MITFLDYIYKGIGGVGQLVVNVTLELNRRGLMSKAYCSTESYEYQRLSELGANFVHIDSEKVSLSDLKRYLEPNDVLFLTHIDNTPLLERIKSLNNRIIFYSVVPDTFFCYGIHMNWICNQKRAALTFINVLYQNDALYFMDGPNVKAVYDKGGDRLGNIRYLPVPVKSYIQKTRETNPTKELNITYLGRGNSDWKVYPVVKILEDLNHFGIAAKLTVITDINEMYQRMIQEYLPNNAIQIEYINNLYGESLDEYLFNNSSLHIAMGTSALEGAVLGVPTILIDYSKQKFPDQYLYRWLFECKDYCLGGEVVDGILPYAEGKTLDRIIDEISNDDEYRIISEKCLSYVCENHSISRFVDVIINAMERTTMTTQIYCSTRFSKNMRYIKPLLNLASKIKHLNFK